MRFRPRRNRGDEDLSDSVDAKGSPLSLSTTPGLWSEYVEDSVLSVCSCIFFNQLLKKGSPGRTATSGVKGRQGNTRNGLRGKVDYCICGSNLRIGLPTAA
jgi:hypothetical protein